MIDPLQHILAVPLATALTLAAPLGAQAIDFGSDIGEWALDEECDDRRFVGPGMASVLTWDYVGEDATDCRAAYDAGQLRLWDIQAARAATICEAIDFGDDGGAYPQDGECDDMRFEGPAVALQLVPDNIGGDASDCARLCAYGIIALRDY